MTAGEAAASAVINQLQYFKGLLGRVDEGYYVQGLSITALVLLFLCLYQRGRAQKARRQREVLDRIVASFKLSKGVEENASELLEIFEPLVRAGGYYFYIRDPQKDSFVLKAVRHAEDGEGKAGPAYSGLLPYKKEEYLPPLSLPVNSQPSTITQVKEGAIPLLVVPVQGGRALVRIGPVKGVARKNKEMLNYISRSLQPVIDVLIDMEGLKNRVDIQTASTLAMHNVAQATMDYAGTIGMMMELAINMIAASGGALLVSKPDGYDVVYLSRTGDQAGEVFRVNTAGHGAIDRVLAKEDLRALTREDRDFYELPSFLSAGGIEVVILVNVPAQKKRGIAVFWYNEAPQVELRRFTGLQLMIKRVSDILDSKQKFDELSRSYLDMLKMMAEAIDNLNPHTTGYSELMARYAGIIAREMNLDKEEIQDVVLAAALSNIGVLGFPNDLLLKPGQYSDSEYETMKLHSEVGAAIVEATLGNKRVADYIRYHHERMDGNGYPAGLKGEDIPLGARIVAVVQTFLAKISGRQYRDPLPFEKAMELLKTAAGTQLDPDAVNALVGWFKKKQAQPASRGRSLGACWEMRCAPPGICAKCPAFGRTDRNCWEVEGVMCEAHGNACATCFVYTEYLYRMGPKFDKLLG
ncbi:MAG: HD domain-containing phosphohydrolase [Peptococcaceae bacterium]|nr:HD domain-containing protein [Peptococcaceae bacterium]MDH7523970.1 HD domain-containing phosphohydrolase [Peptococcaceae bacterium]